MREIKKLNLGQVNLGQKDREIEEKINEIVDLLNNLQEIIANKEITKNKFL